MGQSQFSVILVDDLSQSSGIGRLIEEYSFLNFKGKFKQLANAIEYMSKSSPDILIFDVKRLSLEDFQRLAPLSHTPEIIVLNNDHEPALELVNGNQVFYLNKPIKEEEFLLTLKHAIQTLNSKIWRRKRHKKIENPRGHMFIKNESMFHRLTFDNIDYVHASDGGVNICYNGECLKTKYSLTVLENELPDSLFCRVHKSYMVRLDRIESFTSSIIQLADISIPLGRANKQKFEAAIIKIS